MSKVSAYTPENKHLLIPRALRHAMAVPHIAAERIAPEYKLNAPDYDRVPLYSFLVETMMGTGGLVPTRAMRIVKPNDPSGYPPKKLTPGRRLIYVFWLGTERITMNNARGVPVAKGNSPPRAVKMLKDATMSTFRHVVMPGEDGYEMLDAFKIACDIRRAGVDHRMSPELLYRALGIDRDLQAKYLVEAFT